MNININRIFLLFLILMVNSSCSTAINVVDTTTSAIIDTTEGIVHYSTCPFTKKECF